jgi:hypothetical protein
MKTRVIVIAVLIIYSLFWVTQAQVQVHPQPSKAQLKTHSNLYQITLSCFYGISASRVIGEGLRKTYFEPTSGKQMVIGQPWGVEVEGVFSGYFGIASGFRHQHMGQNTKKRIVMFSDDIYLHDFQTTAEISYLSVPLILKGGIMKEKYWAFVRLGGEGQLMTGEKLSWQIDGKDAFPGSARMPAMTINPTTSSFLLGCEAGIKYNKNGFYLLGDLFYGRKSFAYGLPGTAVTQSGEFFVGYRRFF